MKISPCKDCKERYPACHDECIYYATWKTERDKSIRYTNEQNTQFFNNRMYKAYIKSKNRRR